MLLIKNIGTLATPLGTSSRCGSDQGKIEVLHNAAVLIDGEKIAAVTANGELPESSADRKSTRLNSSHRSLSRMPSSA